MRSLLLLLLVSITAFIQSCSTEKSTVASADKSSSANDLPDHDPRKRLATEKFIEANKMDILGDHNQAMNLYKEALKIDPSMAAADYNLAKILYNSKQYSDAIQYAAQAVKLNPKNTWYLDLYGTLLGGLGNYKEAQKIYEQMVAIDPDDADAWFNRAFFTEQNKQYDEAISIFNQIEERFGITEDVSTEKEKLWLQLGKKDKAADELKKLIDANSKEPKYYSLLIDFYMTNGMEDKAFDVLQKLVDLDPGDPRANLVLADYYQRKGETEKAFESFRKAFANPDLDIGVGMSVLYGYLPYFQNPADSGNEKKQQALDLAKVLIQSHPQEAKAHAMYGDLLYQGNKFDDALSEYNQSIALDNSKFLVWQQLFFLYDHKRNYDSLLAVSARAIELFPDQAMAYYFNGYADMRLKKYDDAVKLLSKAVDIGTGDKKFLAQMYSDLGDSYYYLKNNHASDSCYELALVFDPSNAYVLNNYSYFLSLRSEKLDEAQKMAEQANILSPNTAAYEDTYAWVLYKSGKYKDAKDWLSKALQNGGDQDGAVLEHYGDILFKLGDVDGAVQYWMKAKVKNVESETIDKKIAERKLYE
ncbi:MAG TPA: tetratricopeptide repeat protein [Chitinophagales bacterium]|nr:tetratricopeptide repeat protein [Chitinophagales bacterium]